MSASPVVFVRSHVGRAARARACRRTSPRTNARRSSASARGVRRVARLARRPVVQLGLAALHPGDVVAQLLEDRVEPLRARRARRAAGWPRCCRCSGRRRRTAPSGSSRCRRASRSRASWRPGRPGVLDHLRSMPLERVLAQHGAGRERLERGGVARTARRRGRRPRGRCRCRWRRRRAARRTGARAGGTRRRARAAPASSPASRSASPPRSPGSGRRRSPRAGRAPRARSPISSPSPRCLQGYRVRRRTPPTPPSRARQRRLPRGRRRRERERRPSERIAATMRALLVTLAAALALALAGAAPAAATADRPITFYFGLERPERAARQAFFAVGDPASPGAPAVRHAGAGRGALRGAGRRSGARSGGSSAAAGFGVTFDASGVFARVRGPVARFERVFDVRIRRQFDNDVFANTYSVRRDRRLRLPAAIAPLVRDVVALYSRSTKQPSASAAAGPAGQRRHLDRRLRRGPEDRRIRLRPGPPRLRHRRRRARARAAPWRSSTRARASRAPTAASSRAASGSRGCARGRCLTDGQAKPFGRGSFEPQEDLALVRGMAPGLASVTFTQVWLAHRALVPRRRRSVLDAGRAAGRVLDLLRRVRAARPRPAARGRRRARARG